MGWFGGGQDAKQRLTDIQARDTARNRQAQQSQEQLNRDARNARRNKQAAKEAADRAKKGRR